MTTNADELRMELERTKRENTQLKMHLDREVNARMARHQAKRTLTRIQRACKRLGAPVPPKRNDGVITPAWRADRSARKAARKQLRRIGAVIR